MQLKLDSASRSVVDAVSQIIDPVYLVGGSVRDLLLGKIPNDYDFTTALKPDEIEAKIRASGRRVYLSGKRFGTIGFKVNSHLVEVTSFRTETYTTGSRKPQVEFIDDISHDLSRRDFTINAIAMRPDGSLVDPFEGQLDLKNRLIRTVNKPYDRYNEDPLRMLRAARFSAQLNFDIDPESQSQARKKASKILEVSRQRWVNELDKLLLGQAVERGLEFLAESRLINYLIPELAIQVNWNQDSPYHQLDLWHHSLKTTRLVAADIELRWAAWLHDIGKPYVRTINQHAYSNYVDHELVGAEMIDKIGPYLKWPNERTKRVRDIILHHLEPGSPLHTADSEARHND